jgi:hypothetical protein
VNTKRFVCFFATLFEKNSYIEEFFFMFATNLKIVKTYIMRAQIEILALYIVPEQKKKKLVFCVLFEFHN